MAIELRLFRRLALAFALLIGAASAHAQSEAAAPGISYAPPPANGPEAGETPQETEQPRETRRERSRRPGRARYRVQPYLEVTQVLSADLDGGETFTYTSVAAGVDGRIETRRVRAQASYRYQRNIDWSGPDQDVHSGIAQLNADIVPGVLQFDAGALATRTGTQGLGSAGLTSRDASASIYSFYAGPSLATHIGPVSLNASYRLGYVSVDDDDLPGAFRSPYDDTVVHNATASIGMSPGRLPFGWTVGGGYARSDSGGAFDDKFEGAFVRGDIVLPVGPTLALTAGAGYEDLQSSQRDILRDGNGVPVIGPGGSVTPDPTRPRLLTYDVDGLIYDGGIIWRPSPRTELQARAGHRYGGTTVVATLQHRFNGSYGVSAAVFDTVQTFGGTIINDLSNLPTSFEISRNPFTGNLGGCAFGTDPGAGQCFDQSLQSIRTNSFRARGASILFSGNRGLWSFGAGAGYVHRRYNRPDDPAFDIFGGEDESFGLYGRLGRELSRTSDISFDAYATWFSSDAAAFDDVTSIGGTVSYNRRLLYDRLQLLAALGLYHNDGGVADSTVATGLIGLRYTF